jgi:hypothetical protein
MASKWLQRPLAKVMARDMRELNGADFHVPVRWSGKRPCQARNPTVHHAALWFEEAAHAIGLPRRAPVKRLHFSFPTGDWAVAGKRHRKLGHDDRMCSADKRLHH